MNFSKKKILIPVSIALLMLLMPATASADEGYLTRLSTWWSGVKTQITNALAGLGSGSGKPNQANAQNPQPAQNQSPASRLTVSQAQVPAAGSSRASSPTKNPVIASAGEETGESLPVITNHSLLSIAPVQFQPALVLPKREVRIQVSPVPAFTPRSKKPVAALEPAGPQATVAKARARYAPKAEPGETPKYVFKRTTELVPFNNEPLEKIDPLPPDTFTLIHGLFAWLLDRRDEALGQIQGLGLKTSSKLIREKAFAFTGWILEDSGAQALAGLAFWRSLGALPGVAQDSYPNAVAFALSKLSSAAATAKSGADTKAAERVLATEKLDADARAFLMLVLAERAYDQKSFANARRIAKDIPAKSTWKEQARYLAAVSAMGTKDEAAGYQTAGRELTELFRSVENPEVFDATAVTLGRIHFILGNYDAAHKYLSQVTRDTNLFIEAAVDNAWALLRSGDRNHAVGNMFTLHTPYFDGAYMPESFFLQSLGYQEICQFGDALSAVKQYKARYNEAFKKLIDFNAGGKTSELSYYDDLVTYLSHKEPRLSGIVLRELGRHPEFLKRQRELNQIARDEAQVAKLTPTSAPAVTQWLGAQLTQIRDAHKKDMARFMKTRALAMEDELKFLTANISLLEYEIFAGAGQNLSLQGAQNFAVDDKAAQPTRKFEDGKEYWPYEDEIWEDELNNFRSKIVDGCAKVKKTG